MFCDRWKHDQPGITAIHEGHGISEQFPHHGRFHVDSPPRQGEEEVAVEAKACCEPAIEGEGQTGLVEGNEACFSECAYAACIEALDRFIDLRDETGNPETYGKCDQLYFQGLIDDCKARVETSFSYYVGFLQDNFAACVASIIDEDPGTVFSMGNPSCSEAYVKTGCLIAGVLDMTCQSQINFGAKGGVCTEALHQAPVSTSQLCVVGIGGGEVSNVATSESADFTSGNVVWRYFDCDDTLCPLVLDGLEVAIEDIESGSTELNDIRAEIIIAAYGLSDGDYGQFEPGALRLRITGTTPGVAGPVPFEYMGSNNNIVYVAHASDLLSLSATFEDGGYEISAYIEEAECEDL